MSVSTPPATPTEETAAASEELRRHTAAVERARAAYHSERDETRWHTARPCAHPGCDRIQKSMTDLCREHR